MYKKLLLKNLEQPPGKYIWVTTNKWYCAKLTSIKTWCIIDYAEPVIRPPGLNNCDSS